MLRSKVIWEDCIDENVCLKVLGKNECFRFSACIRILYEEHSYFVEVSAFDQRWKWSLTKACYNFWEHGIAQLRLCTTPYGDNGAKIVLEACLGISGISKCWTLLAESVMWARAEQIGSEELKTLEVSGILGIKSDDRIRSSSGFIYASSPLSASEIEDILSYETVAE